MRKTQAAITVESMDACMGHDEDQPFFPSPRAKGSYREPGRRTLVVHDPVPEPEEPKPIVVNRAVSPPESGRPNLGARAELGGGEPSAFTFVAAERAYWDRYRAFARRPRVFGAGLTLLGGVLSYEDVHTLLYGGWYTRAAFVGPLALCAGIFPLIFGFPIEHEAGGPPPWWRIGYGTMIGIGAIAGAFLTIVLAR